MTAIEICKATSEYAENAALFWGNRHGRHFADKVLNRLYNRLNRQAAVTATSGVHGRSVAILLEKPACYKSCPHYLIAYCNSDRTVIEKSNIRLLPYSVVADD
ncbi:MULTISPECIES: hypothetical protein [unclassified Neisseria]|uniref:hypothetical protein n=1 Tax=unclassified Neisseria TaxID=2623750 RepID=UPI001072C422|nr:MULTISPECIES: hypothetical protein [unclassified Neisseria]MBF0803544.1 hypothetical protein [Neisseria sp. 19428wB4_WF04]TFU43725.1 hypothetical protein E4T99_04110 [Neisseria sp. WF04]